MRSLRFFARKTKIVPYGIDVTIVSRRNTLNKQNN
jgi:hypothetical protein